MPTISSEANESGNRACQAFTPQHEIICAPVR
jgi:hypothetical protein